MIEKDTATDSNKHRDFCGNFSGSSFMLIAVLLSCCFHACSNSKAWKHVLLVVEDTQRSTISLKFMSYFLHVSTYTVTDYD